MIPPAEPSQQADPPAGHSGSDEITEFIHGTRYSELPEAVVHQARRCLLDTIGIAAAGTGTKLSRIMRAHVDRQSGGSGGQRARLLFDGRQVGAADAALANAATIDSMDGHDGHRLVKGHAGVAVVPAALAFLDHTQEHTMGDLLTAVTIGYELSLRAGIALHGTADSYHSSGAWNAVGAAAVGARLLALNSEATRHALGIAEYSAPRAPMMRAIDHPTMVKDSSAWGARAGVSAAFLAADGFTGAPAELIAGESGSGDLGARWETLEQYFKPYPVCRWAHPAIQAGLALMAGAGRSAEGIQNIEVVTFEAATRLYAAVPTTTEEAQYSLPFALASALVHGVLEPANILEPHRDDRALDLVHRVRVRASPSMTAEFPAVRLAQVNITWANGSTDSSPPTQADGDPESPLDDGRLLEKFDLYTAILRAPERSNSIADIVMSRDEGAIDDLIELLMAPVD